MGEKHPEACVCERCTCGKHRCPRGIHQPTNAAFRGSTTTATDFQQWPLQQHEQKKRREWQPSESKFEGLTSTREAYQAHGVVVTKTIKPPNGPATSGAKFRGETTTTSDYKKWAQQERFQREKPKYKPSPDKFIGLTTAHTDYPDHGVLPVVPSAKPAPPKGAGNVAFNGTSSTRTDYKAWEVKPQPPREKKEWKPNPASFYGETEVKNAYVHHHVQGRMPSVKPAPNTCLSDVSFSGTTENMEKYKEWKEVVRPPPSMAPAKYNPTEAPFDGKTTTRTAYTAHTIEPAKSAKPAQAPVSSSAKFHSATESRECYRAYAHSEVERPPQRPPRTWQPTDDVFESATVSALAYTAHPTQHVESYKPKLATSKVGVEFRGKSEVQSKYREWEYQAPPKREKRAYVANTNRFDGATTMRVSYDHKKLPNCPMSGYKYDNTELTTSDGQHFAKVEQKQGHIYFADDGKQMGATAPVSSTTTVTATMATSKVASSKKVAMASTIA